jgi:hypothetical protein
MQAILFTHKDSCRLDRSEEVAEHLRWEQVAESPPQAHRSHEEVVTEELLGQQPAVEGYGLVLAEVE